MARYVPKTYNNKRLLRIVLTTITVGAISIVVLFLVLFFVLSGYVVDGRLELPWLDESSDTAVIPSPPLVIITHPEDAEYDAPPVEEDSPSEEIYTPDDSADPYDEPYEEE